MSELENAGTVVQQVSTIGLRFQEEAVKKLRASLRGDLLLPGDSDFDTARKVVNGAIDKTPALIVRCAGVADVISSVKFARANELTVAVRGGGHNVAGNAVCDDGIVIDLSRMRSIRVDPERRTAHAEPGARWRDFDHETQAHGLVTPGGMVSSTGIAGLTLGGGIGWLLGKHGLTCDNLLSADVVTADGRFIRTSPNCNEDLLWGLRGGGGNFGIVTSFEYRLHPLGPVLGGTVIYPLDKAQEVLSFYKTFTGEAPDELTANATLYTRPDGVPVVSIDFCYAGLPEEGEKVIGPLKKFGSPLEDLSRPMPYCELQTMFDNPFRIGLQSYWKATFINDVSADALNTVIAHFSRVPSARTIVFIQHYHGAMRRIGKDDAAFSHRDAEYGLLIASYWHQKADADNNIKWTRNFFTAMQPFSMSTVYVNFLSNEGEKRVKAAYDSEKYARLVALKNKYDPTNFFHLNQNIKPEIP
jgi:FAD binding domain-containing protein/berberine-like enzyme